MPPVFFINSLPPKRENIISLVILYYKFLILGILFLKLTLITYIAIKKHCSPEVVLELFTNGSAVYAFCMKTADFLIFVY